MTIDDICPRGQTHPETIMHMLRDCKDAQNYWNQFITQENWPSFSNSPGNHHAYIDARIFLGSIV
jgi:hypothetical protein